MNNNYNSSKTLEQKASQGGRVMRQERQEESLKGKKVSTPKESSGNKKGY